LFPLCRRLPRSTARAAVNAVVPVIDARRRRGRVRAPAVSATDDCLIAVDARDLLPREPRAAKPEQ